VAPDVRFWSAILAFLGYDPQPEPAAFGEQIRAAREAEGLSERELARRLAAEVARVFALTSGNVSETARRLGVQRPTIHKALELAGLRRRKPARE
jgi:ActR/RegA family two-component response regulator